MFSHDEYDEHEDAADIRPLSANLLPPALGLVAIGIGALVYAMSVLAPPRAHWDDALLRCATIVDGHARLICYDRLAGPHAPAKGALAPAGRHPQGGPQ